MLSNHALLQWPRWPLWREISGGSFMLRYGILRREPVPGSGYRGAAGEPHSNAKRFLSDFGRDLPGQALRSSSSRDGFAVAG